VPGSRCGPGTASERRREETVDVVGRGELPVLEFGRLEADRGQVILAEDPPVEDQAWTARLARAGTYEVGA